MNILIFLLICLAILVVYAVVSEYVNAAVRPAILYIYDRDTHEKITSIEVNDLYDTAIIHKNGNVIIIPSNSMTNETLYFENAYCEYDEIYVREKG